MNWGMDWSLLETHFETIVAHFEQKRNAWSRKVDRRVLLTAILDAKDVYEVARRVNLSPPRVHELADEMYRYARKLDGHALAAQAKYPELLPFARRLKLARLGRRLDAKAMAARTRLGTTNYRMIERAARNPRLLSVMAMARALGLTVSKLVDDIEPTAEDVERLP